MNSRELNFRRMSREDLLKIRLQDLPVTLSTPWFLWARSLVEKQLKSRGLAFQPHFWISDEWFCPDGIPGVAVPFFLLHPRLIQLEKEMMGSVDGATPLKRLKILRHEMGHAIDNAYRLRRTGGAQRKQVFGDSKQSYPDYYEPNLYSRSYVRHLGLAYAQSHPDEDFAETFAVWLDPKKQWLARYQGTPALEKLKFMDELMGRLKGQKPLLSNKRKCDSIENMTITLREYYRRKRLRYGILKSHQRPNEFLNRLKRNIGNQNLAPQNKTVQLHNLLVKHSETVLVKSAEDLNAPIYKIEPLYQQIVKSARDNNWQLVIQSESQLQKLLLQSFHREAERFLSEGGSRIWL